MTRRRVVVTGLGLISPVGNTVAEGWDNLVAGRSGIDRSRVRRVDLGLRSSPARSRASMSRTTSPPRKPATWTPSSTTGMAASMQAVQDAGLPHGEALTEARPSASADGGLGHRRPADDRGDTHEDYRSAARGASRRSSCRPRSST
jgi:3-oxoacyl-[acyl-carrier-protein] synthase II